MVHTGFTIYCSTNSTIPNFEASGSNIVSHSVFVDMIQQSYSADVFVPVNCEVGIKSYMCSVAAFNREGEGPRSQALETLIPCNFNGKENDRYVASYPQKHY